jgi:hypothetical protein
MLVRQCTVVRWDLWWTKWHWDGVCPISSHSSNCCTFMNYTVIYPVVSILTASLNNHLFFFFFGAVSVFVPFLPSSVISFYFVSFHFFLWVSFLFIYFPILLFFLFFFMFFLSFHQWFVSLIFVYFFRSVCAFFLSLVLLRFYHVSRILRLLLCCLYANPLH